MMDYSGWIGITTRDSMNDQGEMEWLPVESAYFSVQRRSKRIVEIYKR